MLDYVHVGSGNSRTKTDYRWYRPYRGPDILTHVPSAEQRVHVYTYTYGSDHKAINKKQSVGNQATTT